MSKKNNLVISIFALFLWTFTLTTGFCASTPAAIEYLCNLGMSFYSEGNYNGALSEFNKVLILDSSNETARKYIDAILQKKYLSDLTKEKIASDGNTAKVSAEKDARDSAMEIALKTAPRDSITEPEAAYSRQEAMEDTFNAIGNNETTKAVLGPPVMSKKAAPRELVMNDEGQEKEKKEGGFEITGETQASLGMDSEDAIWKRANGDLNQKNYRVISNTAFDRRENTYDPRVFDRLRLNLNTKNKEGFNLHSNITIDPWSFTGKSSKTTINAGTVGGDSAEVELKYWSNTGYTINNTIFTRRNGASIALSEIKVIDGKTESTIPITNTWGEKLTIPQLKIYREFQPVRELWVDYAQSDSLKLKFFPIAYQDQALTSDDPLKLSNNHIWWEDSPWLRSWLAGRKNTGAVPLDFTRGKLDNSLSFFTRDSDGNMLTSLRGASAEYANDTVSLKSAFASPKGLWQDYGSFDNLINATNLDYRLLDNLNLGSLFTYRVGFDENNKRDVSNYVWGFDTGYEPIEGIKFLAEAATSSTRRDITSPGYETNLRGNAFYFSFMGTFPRKSLMDVKYGYSGIKPDKEDAFFAKYNFYAAQMDTGFSPMLSSYSQTRRDAFWSRHIHFREPLNNYPSGIYDSGLKWDDIEPFRIGNGIDIGRQVLGFRLETSLFDKRFENLFDVRNVHNTSGKFVENVSRDEVTYKINEKLTSKLLGIYQRMPRTTGGVDPFIYDSNTGIFLNNAAIVDGLNPTLKTGSLGLEYSFTDWLSLSGIWEHTNDNTLAYDDYPRGNLNSTSFTTFSEYNKVFRREAPFLYSQTLFPLPPYRFYNIFKTGLKIDPMEDLEIYLDYTKNDFKSAGLVDDNINHVGLEIAYTPTKKLGFYFRYSYSLWNDLTLMTRGLSNVYRAHNNFYTEFKYSPSADDEFTLEYGESGRSPLAIFKYDPFGGSLSTLDTQHIFRMFYRRKF